MDTKAIARDITKRTLGFLSDEAGVDAVSEGERVRVNVTVPDAGFIIGREGENLRALRHILTLMVFKQTAGALAPSNFVFDVNGYNEEKQSYLAALVKNTAHRVLETKQEEALAPMSAYERRIVHLEVEKIAGVKSESVGEREERRVVIKPINE